MRPASIFALLVVAACSSPAASGPAEDAGSPPPSDGSVPPADAASPAPDAGGDSSPSPNDAASGADGGGSAGKLYPLAVGYVWTYDVKPVGNGAVCTDGTMQSQVLDTRALDGKQAFDTSSFCKAAGTTPLAPDPNTDEVDSYFNGSWIVLLDPDLTEGHTWTFFNTSYTWHRETSVTVPAGTFTDCWTAKQNVSYTAYMTYCRGVGMVRNYSQDLNGDGWDAVLTSKSF